MALSKYKNFIAGDILPAENVNSIDPDNLEVDITDEAYNIVRLDSEGQVPVEVLDKFEEEVILTNIQPSEDILYWDTDLKFTKSTSFTKLKEIKTNRAGTYTIWVYGYGGGNTMSCEVRVNGSVILTGSTTSSATPRGVRIIAGSVSTTAGQSIDIYVKSSTSSTSVNLYDIYLKGTPLATPITEKIL